jgi:hypothetical protein
MKEDEFMYTLTKFVAHQRNLGEKTEKSFAYMGLELVRTVWWLSLQQEYWRIVARGNKK